jgi:RimJ/RimL family protein N-acetyltransferase
VITIRRAGPADEDLLLAWANEPATRAASFHRSRMDAATHAEWFRGRLASPTTRLFIGLDGDVPVGQVRLEGGSAGRVEVGISVAPEARGRGIGQALLAMSLEAGRADPDLGARAFVARIRPKNRASIALFAQGGFRLVAADGDCDGVPCMVYELRA